MRTLLLAGVLVACGHEPPARTPVAGSAAGGGELVLYRDRALVQQRVAIDVPPAGYATVRAKLAAGLEADDIYVVERGLFTVRELRVVEPTDVEPTEVELVIGAPRAGRFAIHLGYLTDRIRWDAAYTVTTTPARDRAILRGALAIRNATGIALPAMTVRVIDAELGPSVRRAAELLATSYVGAEPTTSPAAVPRELGSVDLADGETRIELLADTPSRAMRSVLVYDPIGTALDRTTAAPVRDRNLGAGPAPTRVTESFEIERDVAATIGLPGGPVRLFERRADGTLALLAQARLFDPSTRVADVDTIPIGTAEGVTGHRERREYTHDEHTARLVEEFVITIDNRRAHPVEVVVREHLYRGQNWTLAYRSAPMASKEGPQQISMRMIVPPNAKDQLLYIVVYTW